MNKPEKTAQSEDLLCGFEEWLRTVCFREPTPEAYDLARDAWKEGRKTAQHKINYSRRGKCVAQTITQETECVNFVPATSKNHEQVCEHKAGNGKCSRGKK